MSAPVGSVFAGDDLSSPGPELDFSDVNGAWYTVRLVLRRETLIVSYTCFPDSCDERYDAGSFSSADEIARFRKRFRTVSPQMQDYECPDVKPGMLVCAATSDADSVLFFDAVVDSGFGFQQNDCHSKAVATLLSKHYLNCSKVETSSCAFLLEVKREKHLFNAEEEECPCAYILSWINGPKAGTLSLANIADICRVQSYALIDARLDSFIRACEKRLHPSSSSCLAVDFQDSTGEIGHELLEDSDMGGGYIPSASRCQILANRTADCSAIQEHALETARHETDVKQIADYSFILVDNMEKDLAPSTIVNFVHEHTSVFVKAYVFPSLPLELFTRGAIVADSPEDFQKLCDFIINRFDKMIISSDGRPWVVAHLSKCNKSSLWHAGTNEEFMQGNPHSKLKLVQSGCEEYDKAQQLQNLFLEFRNHTTRLHRRLLLEEHTYSALSGCNVDWL